MRVTTGGLTVGSCVTESRETRSVSGLGGQARVLAIEKFVTDGFEVFFSVPRVG
jgi:hypothetical protein